MKTIILFSVLFSLQAMASVIGVSSHPFARKARVVSAQMTGYMSQRQEMGMGLRYTHEIDRDRVADFVASGGQSSRGLLVGAGMDFRLVAEEIYSPKVGIKPFFQHQNFESEKFSVVGVAPNIRKGFSLYNFEFYPYLATPMGMKIDSNDKFVYQAALTLGVGLPIPGDDRMVVSLEGNKNLGASSDYVSCLVSWLWN